MGQRPFLLGGTMLPVTAYLTGWTFLTGEGAIIYKIILIALILVITGMLLISFRDDIRKEENSGL